MLEAPLCTLHKVKILLHSQYRKSDFPVQPAAGCSYRSQGLWRRYQDNHLSSEWCLQWIQRLPSLKTWIQQCCSGNSEVSSLLCPSLTAWLLLTHSIISEMAVDKPRLETAQFTDCSVKRNQQREGLIRRAAVDVFSRWYSWWCQEKDQKPTCTKQNLLGVCV